MSDLDIFRDEYLPNAQGATVSFAGWKKSYPTEFTSWVAYRDQVLAGNLPQPPTMVSKYGKALAAAGQMAERDDMKVTLSTSGGTTDLSGSVTITASPVPATQITKVEIYVDDVLKVSDTSSPYTYVWDTSLSGEGAHQLKAIAFYPRNKKAEGRLDVTVSNTVTPPPPPPPPPQAPPVFTTVPTISGTATEGQTLTVSNGVATNSPTSYTRQWLRCNGAGASCVAIPGATLQSYVLVAADVDATIRCSVIASNDAGPSPAVQTAQTAVVSALAPAVPVNTALPVLSGNPQRGSTLATTNGAWSNQPTSYTYQWVRESIIGANEVGAYFDTTRAGILTAQSATLVGNATVQSLSIYVSTSAGQLRLGIYNDASDKPGTLLAATPEFTPVAGWNTVNVVTPAALTAGQHWLAFLPNNNACVFRSGAYTSDDVRYYGVTYGALPSTFSATPTSDPQHFSMFASMAGTGNISGATSLSYVLVTADVGNRVSCSVKAVNGSGTSAAALTAPSSVITDLTQPPPPPPSTTTPTAPQAPITYVSNVTIGLNIASQTQALWDDYDIQNTGDSGIIMGPIAGNPITTLRRFRLRGIGNGPGAPGYAVHGIYCKRPNTLIEDFDVEMGQGDGLTLRKKGIVVNRFRVVSTVSFACSYFEEDSTGGVVTMKNGTGQVSSGYFMWTGSNPGAYVGNLHQEFVFENVHATIGGSNPKWIGRDTGEIAYDGPGVRLIGCTINGNPVTSAHISNLPIISIS